MFAPKLILSPIDYSGFSLAALETAKELALHYGSELLLMHVVPVIPTLPAGVPFFEEGAYERQMTEAARKALEELADKAAASAIRARTIVGFANDVAMEIVRAAETENVDLIVIATHGMTGWRRLAFGSVTEKVVRTAACPVLVLRCNATAELKDAEIKPHSAAAGIHS